MPSQEVFNLRRQLSELVVKLQELAGADYTAEALKRELHRVTAGQKIEAETSPIFGFGER